MVLLVASKGRVRVGNSSERTLEVGVYSYVVFIGHLDDVIPENTTLFCSKQCFCG